MKERKLTTDSAPRVRFRRYIPLLYGCVLTAMLLLVVLNLTMKSKPGADFGLDGFTSLSDGWQTADGTNFCISQIDTLRREDSNQILIYHTLPNMLGNDKSLMFRTKNCSVIVWIGNRKVYTTDITDAPFYNHSPGTRWNVVKLSDDEASKTIRIAITQAYQDGRAKVDHFYFGDSAAIILYLISSKAMGFIVSLLILFVGFIFLVAWLILNWHRRPKNNSLLWLAAFAFTAGVWSLLETNLFQLFSKNLRLIQTLDDMMLVIGGMPLYLYLDSTFDVFRHRAIRWLCEIDMGYLLLATAFQYLGLWDYHQTLNGAVATYGIVTVILLVCVFHQRREIRTEQHSEHRLFQTLQRIGILLLGLGLLGDLLRYLTADVMDRAFIIRIGLLLFIVFFGSGNIYQMVLLVQKGQQAEFISKLAYSDGLTGIGNRTAYIERLRECAERAPHKPLGFVIFDINNLKKVNDTMGHKAGDEMIQLCTVYLQESFGKSACLYRIGGDEFVALLDGENQQANSREALRRFAESLAKWNVQPNAPFQLVVASGAAFSDSADKAMVELAEKEADFAMYENKYELKCKDVYH